MQVVEMIVIPPYDKSPHGKSRLRLQQFLARLCLHVVCMCLWNSIFVLHVLQCYCTTWLQLQHCIVMAIRRSARSTEPTLIFDGQASLGQGRLDSSRSLCFWGVSFPRMKGSPRMYGHGDSYLLQYGYSCSYSLGGLFRNVRSLSCRLQRLLGIFRKVWFYYIM